MYCQDHNRDFFTCGCGAPRSIESLSNAQAVLASGKASWEEWEESARIFVKHGLNEEAAECIEMAVRQIRRGTTSAQTLRLLVGEYVGIRAQQFTPGSNVRNWLSNFSDQLKAMQTKLNARGDKRLATHLDPEIAELLVLAADRNSSISLIRMASKFRKQKKFDKKVRWNRPGIAIKFLNEVLATEVANIYALNTRAAAHMDLGNTTDALTDATTSIQIDPHHAASYATRAGIYWVLQEMYLAWQDALQAFRLEPRSGVLAILNVCFAKFGSTAQPPGFTSMSEAREFLQRAVASDPDLKPIAIEIATLRLLCDAEDFESALQYLAELAREGWGGNTAYWQTQIAGWAAKTKPHVVLPRFEDLVNRITVDKFPDHQK